MAQGLVSDIQRFSIHDGPGIRTTVFFKGCNLRCFWCHNPETLRPRPELQIILDRCLGCGRCFTACPQGAHSLVDGERAFQREACTACGKCAESCYAQALVLVGRYMSAEEVMAVALRDRVFYRESGGGITLSGGEPLMQPEFAQEVLELARSEGLHTAIETAAEGPWERIARLLPAMDLVMLDIKAMDGALHQAATGVPNERILANAVRLSQEAKPLIVRTPVVPGVNDSEDEIGRVADFIAGFPNLLYYELLPFHRLAAGKYRALGLEYKAAGLARPSREQMARSAEVARRRGIVVKGG